MRSRWKLGIFRNLWVLSLLHPPRWIPGFIAGMVSDFQFQRVLQGKASTTLKIGFPYTEQKIQDDVQTRGRFLLSCKRTMDVSSCCWVLTTHPNGRPSSVFLPQHLLVSIPRLRLVPDGCWSINLNHVHILGYAVSPCNCHSFSSTSLHMFANTSAEWVLSLERLHIFTWSFRKIEFYHVPSLSFRTPCHLHPSVWVGRPWRNAHGFHRPSLQWHTPVSSFCIGNECHCHVATREAREAVQLCKLREENRFWWQA